MWSLISVVVAMPIITARQRGRPSPSVPPLHDAPSNHVIHRCLIHDASSDGGKKQKVICKFIQCKSMKRRPRYTHTQLHLKVEKEKIKYFLFYSLSFSLKIPFVWKKYIIKYWRNIRSAKTNFIEFCANKSMCMGVSVYVTSTLYNNHA